MTLKDIIDWKQVIREWDRRIGRLQLTRVEDPADHAGENHEEHGKELEVAAHDAAGLHVGETASCKAPLHDHLETWTFVDKQGKPLMTLSPGWGFCVVDQVEWRGHTMPKMYWQIKADEGRMVNIGLPTSQLDFNLDFEVFF